MHRPNFSPQGGYLAFLGRISPEKRPDRAIAIARATGLPLKIAAKIDRVDAEYWTNVIEPMIHGVDVEFIGEIGERDKAGFLGNALALLSPIDWPEPFGLVMIEAMACGTPVLAFDCGSVREILKDGITGRVVRSTDEAVAAMPHVLRLDRRRIRMAFELDFTAQRMAADYAAIYRRLIEADCMARPGSETIAAAAVRPSVRELTN